jgi:hypothetical protein
VVTAETALQTMYDIAFPTKDKMTVQTTSQTIRWVISYVGVSVPSLEPNASSHKQIGRKCVSGECYEFVSSASSPARPGACY